MQRPWGVLDQLRDLGRALVPRVARLELARLRRAPIFLMERGGMALGRASGAEVAASNLEEAKAREGRTIAIASEGDEPTHRIAPDVIEIPRSDEMLTPFLTVLPLQLYAYYVADLKGTDVDQPRNLAKTVTVE